MVFSSTLRMTVDLGVNFSLDLAIPMSDEELAIPAKVNLLISECMKLEMPAPTTAKKINSVPQISDYLRGEVADIMESLEWLTDQRIVESTLTAKRPPVSLTVIGALNATET